MNNLQQDLKDNQWPTKSTYKTCLVCQVEYLLVEASNKKWLENESDPQDNKYELPILIYDANQDALVQQKKRKTRSGRGGAKNTITISN